MTQVIEIAGKKKPRFFLSAICVCHGGHTQTFLRTAAMRKYRTLPTLIEHVRMNLPKREESSMPISIKDPQTDAKIRDLATLTGESITEAVRIAIEQRLRRESSRRRAGVASRLLSLSLAKNINQTMGGSANATIGYDDFGLPT
jgi:antitoxin VapB